MPEPSGWDAIDAMTPAQALMVQIVYGQGGIGWRGISSWCSERWGPGWGEGNQIAGMEICERAEAMVA